MAASFVAGASRFQIRHRHDELTRFGRRNSVKFGRLVPLLAGSADRGFQEWSLLTPLVPWALHCHDLETTTGVGADRPDRAQVDRRRHPCPGGPSLDAGPAVSTSLRIDPTSCKEGVYWVTEKAYYVGHVGPVAESQGTLAREKRPGAGRRLCVRNDLGTHGHEDYLHLLWQAGVTRDSSKCRRDVVSLQRVQLRVAWCPRVCLFHDRQHLVAHQRAQARRRDPAPAVDSDQSFRGLRLAWPWR